MIEPHDPLALPFLILTTAFVAVLFVLRWRETGGDPWRRDR